MPPALEEAPVTTPRSSTGKGFTRLARAPTALPRRQRLRASLLLHAPLNLPFTPSVTKMLRPNTANAYFCTSTLTSAPSPLATCYPRSAFLLPRRSRAAPRDHGARMPNLLSGHPQGSASPDHRAVGNPPCSGTFHTHGVASLPRGCLDQATWQL